MSTTPQPARPIVVTICVLEPDPRTMARELERLRQLCARVGWTVLAEHQGPHVVPTALADVLAAAIHRAERDPDTDHGVVLSPRDAFGEGELAQLAGMLHRYGVATYTAPGDRLHQIPGQSQLCRLIGAALGKIRAAALHRASVQRGSVPLGYMVHPNNPGQLIPNEQERAAALSAFRMQQQGVSLRSIGRLLTREGFKPRGKMWGHETVSRLLVLGASLAAQRIGAEGGDQDSST